MDLLTPTAVEEEILRISELLERATTELACRARRSAECETDYKIGFAWAMLKSELKTVGERESEALIICENQYRERHLAAAMFASAEEASRNYRAQLSAMQSVYRAVTEHAGLR